MFELAYLGRVELKHTQLHIGSGQLIAFQHGVRETCSEIRKNHLSHSPLVNCMRAVWDSTKVEYYLDQIVETTIRPVSWQIDLVSDESRSHRHCRVGRDGDSYLMVAQTRWQAYLSNYATLRGIVLLSYPSFDVLGQEIRRIARVLRFTARHSPHVARSISLRIFSGMRREWSANLSPDQPTIGIQYYFRKLVFEPSERSEFFWLDGVEVPDKKLLLYKYNSTDPIDPRTKEELDRHGVRINGIAPGVSPWVPTIGMWLILCRSLITLLLGVFKSLIKGQWFSLYYFRHGVLLAAAYAYWHNYFSVNQIKVNLAPMNLDIGQNLALDALGGVGAGFQYSLSVFAPTTMTAGTGDVQFVFSPKYEKSYRRVKPPTDVYIPSGYIYDGAFEPLRSAGRAAELREQIRSRGAEFIMSFFDEGPVDRWDSTYWAKHLRDEYAYLVDWVIEDRSLAVIFKPKRSIGLFEILAPISEKVDLAIATGRCVFLTGQTMVGTLFPAEAAMASDLSVGKITGATASLEASLAGVRSVLLDNDHFHNHPLRDLGENQVIFDDWPSLRDLILRYRNDPESYPEFGNWSAMIDEIDPFRDGNSGIRIGNFIGSIYEGLRDGLSKAESLDRARAAFSEKWLINTHVSLTAVQKESSGW